MPFPYSLNRLIHGDLFNTLLPDFVLGFVFFTSVIYAVLSRRFGQQRPAVAMSAALGMALTIGLVWWEYVNDFSIKNLGSIAAGFAVIVLGGVLYQAIRHVGGSWSGAAIAIGACLLVGWTLGFALPVDAEIVQTLTIVTLTGGMIAFLLHRHGHGNGPRGPHGVSEDSTTQTEVPEVHRTFSMPAHLARHMSSHKGGASKKVAKKTGERKIPRVQQAKRAGRPAGIVTRHGLKNMTLEQLTELITAASTEAQRRITELREAIR